MGEEEKKNNNNNNKNKKNTDENRKQVYDDDSLYFQSSKKLFERILENNPDHKESNLQKWADDARLMIERDGRTEEQVVFLIDWSQQHYFWASNILSIAKLREKFDQLVMQFKKEREAAKSPSGRGKLREEKKPAWFGQPEPSQSDAADEDPEFLAKRTAMEAELAAREAGKRQKMKVTR